MLFSSPFCVNGRVVHSFPIIPLFWMTLFQFFFLFISLRKFLLNSASLFSPSTIVFFSVSRSSLQLDVLSFLGPSIRTAQRPGLFLQLTIPDPSPDAFVWVTGESSTIAVIGTFRPSSRLNMSAADGPRKPALTFYRPLSLQQHKFSAFATLARSTEDHGKASLPTE